VQEHVARVLRGERVDFEVPIDVRGRTRQLAGSYAPHVEKGIVQGFVVLGLDITERKNTEALLVLQAEALAWSNRELEEFVYLVSHDLHEPLRTIRGFAQLLESRHKAELGPDAVDYLNFITDGAQRMQQMIDGLLAYSRVTRADKPASAPVDMNEVARAAIANLTAAIASEGAIVRYDELPMVTGDASRLIQVLQNLIGNALKYRAASPPLIQISAKQQEGGWVFAVSDNGQGFAQQDADRIFGLFKRLHGRDVPGTGIGLAICHKIIEQHHGRIWAESSPGGGATFYFTLSAAPGEPQTPEQAQLTLA
jgi:light-regulated signal transduction histidine kinase (bacteriophytochrome)